MEKLTEKISLRQHIKNIKNLYKIINEIDKNYFKNNGLTISVVDRTSPAYYISFDPQLFTLYCNIDEITQPFLFNIDVRLW